MSDKFILQGHNTLPCLDLMTWAKWFERADRIVRKTQIGGARVSTVFLGIDHNFGEKGAPLLFETMIFGGPHDQYQERCSTWDQAEAQHVKACELVCKCEPEKNQDQSDQSSSGQS